MKSSLETMIRPAFTIAPARTSAIKVESNVPLPKGGWGRMRSLRLAISGMKVGDSFAFENNKHPYKIAKELGVRITVRKISGDFYRVWRLE